MPAYNEKFEAIGTARIRLMIDFVASVNGLSYAELADELGVNRGWFTRYRNGSILDFGATTLYNLVELCSKIDSKMLLEWLLCEDLKHD